LINLFIASIIAGIIIDTFSELRTKADEIKRDNDNACMVCSLDKEDFETIGLNF